jgi:uncharacterized membrane protein
MVSNAERIGVLEQELRILNGKVAEIERVLGLEAEPVQAPRPAAWPVSPEPVTTAPPAPLPTAPSRPPRRERQEIDLEELLGGRLLALVGGLAVVLGLAFLVALAVERGWLDEVARTSLAFAGSGALLVLGAWLHERRGRTQASLAAVGTGLAGLFLSLTAATVLYDLVPV